MADTATQKSGVNSTLGAEDTKSKISDTKSQVSDTKSEAPAPEEKAGEATEDVQTDSGVDGLQTEAQTEAGDDKKTDAGDDKQTEADDDNESVLPAGSVNGNLEVVNESGKVIGKVDSKDKSLQGSMVDGMYSFFSILKDMN